MLYVGADLHKDQVTFVVLNCHGDRLLKKLIACKCVNQIHAFFAAFKEPFQLTVEAVCFVEWFIDRYRTCVDRIDIADATVTLCRSDASQEAIRQRLIKRVGKPKANVAMGRRLLRTIYAMMKNWTFYQVGQRTNHLAKANKARSKKRKIKKEAA